MGIKQITRTYTDVLTNDPSIRISLDTSVTWHTWHAWHAWHAWRGAFQTLKRHFWLHPF
jgi:hypothetical protein